MRWFGPSKKEIWQQLCAEIGARFVDEGWKGNHVELRDGPWTLTLDTYAESSEDGVTYTRMRAPFVNPDRFRFRIYRKGLFTDLGKLLGMQDVEVGAERFDEAFVIQSNDPDRVRTLLADSTLRDLLAAQPTIRLEIKDREPWPEPPFPPKTDELHFHAAGVIKDKERLKRLFDLFIAMLDRMAAIGIATKDDPGVRH